MDNSDAMDIDGPPPPPAQQRAEMLACDPAGSLVAGTHYYLVEQKWFNTWTDFSTAVENAEPLNHAQADHPHRELSQQAIEPHRIVAQGI